jgi:hypothetical protein
MNIIFIILFNFIDSIIKILHTHTHTQIYTDKQKSLSNLDPNHSYVQYDSMIFWS